MSMFPGRFAGRSAIITGGASGLGLLASKRIIEEGGRVSLWDLNVSAPGASQKLPPGAHAVQVDVANHANVAAAAQESKVALGKIDILINCAGITGTPPWFRTMPSIAGFR